MAIARQTPFRPMPGREALKGDEVELGQMGMERQTVSVARMWSDDLMQASSSANQFQASSSVHAYQGSNFRYALVGAAWCVICALPTQFDFAVGWRVRGFTWLVRIVDCDAFVHFTDEYSPPAWSCLIYLFVIGPTTGQTMHSIFQVLVGICAAVSNHALFLPMLIRMHSSDSSDGRYVTFVCWMNFMFFVIFAFVYDFGPKARVIALHLNTAWTVQTLDPRSTDLWSDFWGVSVLGVVVLLRTSWGCFCALLATQFFRVPAATKKAMVSTVAWADGAAHLFEAAWECVSEEPDEDNRINAKMFRERTSSLSSDFDGGDANILQSLELSLLLQTWRNRAENFGKIVTKANVFVSEAWWERFSEANQQAYCTLASAQLLGKQIRSGIELLSVHMDILQCHSREYRTDHITVSVRMRQVIPPDLLPLAREMLICFVTADADQPWRADMRRIISQLHAACEIYKDRLSALEFQDREDVHSSVIILMWAIEAYARLVADAAAGRFVEDKVAQHCRLWDKFKAIRLTDTHGQMQNIIRNTACIGVGAFVGVNLMGYDAYIALTVGWLAYEMESSWSDKLHRLSGGLLGLLVSASAYTAFGDCARMDTMVLIGLLFASSGICLYTTVSFVEMSNFALYFGTFATVFLVKQCNEQLCASCPTMPSLWADMYQHAFQTVRGAVCGMCAIFVADLLLQPKTSVPFAARALLEIWKDLRCELENFLLHEPSKELKEHRANSARVGVKNVTFLDYFGEPPAAPEPEMLEASTPLLARLPGLIAAARRVCDEAAFFHIGQQKEMFPASVAREVLMQFTGLQQDLLLFSVIGAQELLVYLQMRGKQNESRHSTAHSRLSVTMQILEGRCAEVVWAMYCVDDSLKRGMRQHLLQWKQFKDINEALLVSTPFPANGPKMTREKKPKDEKPSRSHNGSASTGRKETLAMPAGYVAGLGLLDDVHRRLKEIEQMFMRFGLV